MKKSALLLIPSLLLFSLLGCQPSQTGDIVNGEKGTLNNPYTIAEAISVIGTSTSYSSDEIFIKGVVKGNPYHNTTYNSYSVYLYDEGGTKSVQVYSGTIEPGAGYSNVLEGDTIVAGGHYTYYASKSQPELAGSNSVPYPKIYKITRPDQSSLYETKNDNGQATQTLTISFDDEHQGFIQPYGSGDYIWEEGIFKMIADNGSQYSFTPTYVNPFRFYVGSYLHFELTSGRIKYMDFVTDQYYPFTGTEPCTNCMISVASKTSATIYAKLGQSKLKIHNSDSGDTAHGKKQVRIYSITVCYYTEA